MRRRYANEIETVRLSSNEGKNMKGARQRIPVRSKRLQLTLLASAFYAAFTLRSAAAQTLPGLNRVPPASNASDSALSSNAASASAPVKPAARRHFDGQFMRAQHRTGGKSASGVDRDPHPPAQVIPTMQPILPFDQQPSARPPRHEVMTPDERRLLRQHIEEAVRDLYKR
jgi:hypothetical protein